MSFSSFFGPSSAGGGDDLEVPRAVESDDGPLRSRRDERESAVPCGNAMDDGLRPEGNASCLVCLAELSCAARLVFDRVTTVILALALFEVSSRRGAAMTLLRTLAGRGSQVNNMWIQSVRVLRCNG